MQVQTNPLKDEHCVDEHPQANEQHRSEPLPRNALPNGLIDDERIGMTGLYLAAYRASQGPGFALNVTDVHKRFRIGTTAFYTAIRQLKQTGWYARYQPRTSEPRQFARDHIVNRQIGRTGYLISKSEWFERDASSATSPLTTKEIAVWLFMRSHAPTFKIRAYTIRDRFDITRQTATKLLRRLEAAGLIWRVNAERQAGRFTMVEYTAHEPQGGRNSTVLNLPGTVGPDAGRRDT